MTEGADISDDSKVRIEILLKEYDTLRQEIISRTNNRFAITGFFGAVALFAVTKEGLDAFWKCAISVASLVFLLALWLWIKFLIDLCAQRIAKIERRINELAGDTLLEWETEVAKRPVSSPFKKFSRFLQPDEGRKQTPE